ncbi:MAG: PAS domain-containing protein, partial [Candidatus Cloacimonetes bacterium]|nr:PAS domain-containing protein [Candidatus Cloacimonadota bacterium]
KENEIRRQRFVSLIALSILLIIIIMLVSFLYHLKLMTNKKLKNEISERKKTELQLADSEKLLKLVIDSIPAHIFLKNKDYKYVMVNKTMKDYYQLLDEDFINHDLFDILQKFPTLNEVFNKCIYNDILVIEEKDNREITMEVMNPHDTSKQWFNSKTKYIEFGQQDHILGVSLDITPLKLAQKKLENINSSLETIVSKRTKQLMGTNKKLKLEIFERIKIERKLAHSELQYRTLLHNIPQRIFYKDLNSIYQLCNKSFADEVGKSIEEIFEKNDYDLFEKDVAKNFIENDKKVLSTMKIMEFDERYLKNDTECIVHTVKAPIRDENGDVIGLLGIFWDVTAQRKAEQQILYSERISGIGEMAGGVAHEIKNPLSNISSAIQLLEEDIETNEEISSLIKIIHDSVTDASDTISKLISFASPQELTLKDGDLWQIMKHTLTLLKGNFTQSNIKLTSHKTGEFPIIKVDEVHMKSAIMNIAMNAIQAMPNGGTFDIQGIADKTQIKLIFTDSGCGISKNQLNKIFDPFFTTKKIGSGLGMGLIYSVMKFHSGTIDVKSKVDVGTEITLTFPLI